MTKKNKAMLQMIVCSILWSIAGIVIKQINCNALVITGFRSLISAATVFVFMKITGLKFTFSRKIIPTAICMCVTFFCFVGANKLTTAANAIVLQFTSPVFVMLMSAVIYKTKFKPSDIAAVLLTLFGISLFFFDQLDSGSMLGNIVAVLAGFFMAGIFVFGGNSSRAERMTGTLAGHIVTAVIGLSCIPFTQNIIDEKAVIGFFVLGVFQLGIPYILVALALSDCPPLACNLIGVLEPLLNPVWVFIFNGEKPGRNAFIGAVIILVSVTAWCIYKDREQPENQS